LFKKIFLDDNGVLGSLKSFVLIFIANFMDNNLVNCGIGKVEHRVFILVINYEMEMVNWQLFARGKDTLSQSY
jgi:hypothetical protein